MRKSNTPGMMYSMFLSKALTNNTEKIFIILNQNNISISNGFSAFVPLNVGQFQDSIKYDSFYRKLLPKPFQTQCIKYPDIGFDSRGQCYEKCLIKAVRLETNDTRIPPAVGIYSNKKKKVISLSELKSPSFMEGKNESFKQMLNRFESVCEEKCRAMDCESIILTPWTLGSFNSDKPLYSIFLPLSPTISSISEEAVSLIQFMTDMVSALGFWLGISAFGLRDLLKKSSGISTKIELAMTIMLTKWTIVVSQQHQTEITYPKPEQKRCPHWKLVLIAHSVNLNNWSLLF